MANIDKVSVKNTVYNIVSPAVVSDYIEVIGGACTKPDGYVEDEVILAKQNDVQLLFKATQTIAFGANIVENTNCVRTTLEEVLKNAGGGGGASSADQVSYDNSDSGLEAENVQEAVDELATNAGTASSQIQTLTNEISAINEMGAINLLKHSSVSSTELGITWTVNSDGTVTANSDGTNTSNILKFLDADFSAFKNGGIYKLSCCPSGGAINSTYAVWFHTTDNSVDLVDIGNGVVFTYNSAKTYQITLIIYANYNASNVVFKPMITLATVAQSDYAHYQPYSMTNQELTPIAQAVSNRNLLDNPWFTVNQRGQASYTVDGTYTVDRWKLANTNDLGSVAVGDGLTIDNTNGSATLNITQTNRYDEAPFKNLLGKTVTLSVLLSDGSILSDSGVIPSSPSSWTGIINIPIPSKGGIALQANDNRVLVTIGVHSSKSVTIKAIKLELGSVSTLAQDTAPNYATELLKCQRYFYKAKDLCLVFGSVSQTSDRYYSNKVLFPVRMRTTPTATYNNASGQSYCAIIQGKKTYSTSDMPSTLNTYVPDADGIAFSISENGGTQIQFYDIDFSADL